MKNFIANIPYKIGIEITKIGYNIVLFGLKLHEKWNTKLGQNFKEIKKAVDTSYSHEVGNLASTFFDDENEELSEDEKSKFFTSNKPGNA